MRIEVAYSREELEEMATSFKTPAQVEAFRDVVHHVRGEEPVTNEQLVAAIEFYADHLGDSLVREMTDRFGTEVMECCF